MTENIVKKLIYTFVLLLALLMVITAFSSCAPSGYGCHGRSKCMTRVR